MLIEAPKDPVGPIFIQGEYSQHGVWVTLLGGDFEAYVDNEGLTTQFRRRGKVRVLNGCWHQVYTGNWSFKALGREEFNRELTDELALAIRKCIVPDAVIAKSSQLVTVIKKAMGELEVLRDSPTMDKTKLQYEIETVRLRMFSRLMAADLRKGPLPE